MNYIRNLLWYVNTVKLSFWYSNTLKQVKRILAIDCSDPNENCLKVALECLENLNEDPIVI